MTVKNYVLDINKTSLQHPSIVLRQDDYNIYTVNISVTENGLPVNLGSYTLNFLGITPAGAKIIDGDNFITTPADLAAGKFSYKFPKEAAGSKGVYDVAYFRLKTTSGATSTIDLNLRVLGGIDLTADEVKDYITVDDTLRNTLVSEVFKRIDAKVDEHLATVKKGDKGEKGDPGKDGYMPIIGGRNYILNSLGMGASNDVRPALKGSYSDSNALISYLDTGVQVSNNSGNREWFYGLAWAFIEISATPLVAGNTYTISFKVKGTAKQVAIRVGIKTPTSEFPITNFTNINNSDWTKVSYTFTIPSETISFFSRIQGAVANSYLTGFDGNEMFVMKEVKLEEGNVPTDWTPAPEDAPSNDTQLVHKTGNEVLAGDKTFTSNTTLATTTILAGNYGLRVTPSGFQKTTDGKTWVSANI